MDNKVKKVVANIMHWRTVRLASRRRGRVPRHLSSKSENKSKNILEKALKLRMQCKIWYFNIELDIIICWEKAFKMTKELVLDDVYAEMGMLGRFQIRTYCLILIPILFSAVYICQYIFAAGAVPYRQVTYYHILYVFIVNGNMYRSRWYEVIFEFE